MKLGSVYKETESGILKKCTGIAILIHFVPDQKELVEVRMETYFKVVGESSAYCVSLPVNAAFPFVTTEDKEQVQGVVDQLMKTTLELTKDRPSLQELTDAASAQESGPEPLARSESAPSE